MDKHGPPVGEIRRRDRHLIFWAFWTSLWLMSALVFVFLAAWGPARDHGGVIAGAAITGGLSAFGTQRVRRIYRAGVMILIVTNPTTARIGRVDRRPRRPTGLPSVRTPLANLDRAAATSSDLLRHGG